MKNTTTKIARIIGIFARQRLAVLDSGLVNGPGIDFGKILCRDGVLGRRGVVGVFT
jgi:hypothetical protein